MRCLCLSALLLISCPAFAELSPNELTAIGKKVWRNECAGTVEGLTSWNAGENFASLGIGHFIWYPAGNRGPFEESFPKLVAFVEARGIKLPAFTHGPCPWNSRAEFQHDIHSERMNTLRKFLTGTIAIQAEFLAQRMHEALPKMLAEAPAAQREKIRQTFERLSQTSRGTFALIDYVNFKGEGTLATERYHDKGWGLLQVLEAMNGEDVRAFSDAAKKVLTRRVQNSPPERHEERWLSGWINRVESYTN